MRLKRRVVPILLTRGALSGAICGRRGRTADPDIRGAIGKRSEVLHERGLCSRHHPTTSSATPMTRWRSSTTIRVLCSFPRVHEKFFRAAASARRRGRKVTEVIENHPAYNPCGKHRPFAEVGPDRKIAAGSGTGGSHAIRYRRDGKVVGAIGRVMFQGPQQSRSTCPAHQGAGK